ncbi:MAG TPA: peptidoglycan-binding protein [Trichocoleus sp.]|jgi:peptidoglycan hydrolase-like protein with peptidoglycan-binding domain
METFAYLEVAQMDEQFAGWIETIATEEIQSQLLARLLPVRCGKVAIGLLCLSSAVWTTAAQTAAAVEDFDPSFGSRSADTGYTDVRAATANNTTKVVTTGTCNTTNVTCVKPCNTPVIYPAQPDPAYIRPSVTNDYRNPGFVNVRPNETQPIRGVFLRRGDNGETVRQVQELLRSAGYFDAPATGFFASLTESGVKAFQRDRGLGVDGIVGEATWIALGGGSYRPITPTPPVTPTPGIPVGGTNQLRIGDRGPYVADLQIALRQLGFYSGPITGIYEANTEQAVIAFQRSNNLAISGIADSTTLDRLGLGGYT